MGLLDVKRKVIAGNWRPFLESFCLELKGRGRRRRFFVGGVWMEQMNGVWGVYKAGQVTTRRERERERGVHEEEVVGRIRE